MCTTVSWLVIKIPVVQMPGESNTTIEATKTSNKQRVVINSFSKPLHSLPSINLLMEGNECISLEKKFITTLCLFDV